MCKIFTIIFVVIAISLNSYGQINFTASAKNQVAVGEQFRFAFEINAAGENFKPPVFKNFRIISGPNTSSSTSISIVGGRTTQTQTYTYSYVLQATKEGHFTIPAATIVVNRQTISSNTVDITVVASHYGGRQPHSGTQPHHPQQRPQQQPEQKEDEPKLKPDDVFIKVTADKTTAWAGEPIVLTYKLYTKIQILNYAIDKTPGFDGFWSENLIDPGTNLGVSEEVIDGQRYTTAIIRRVLLFPQRSGTFAIDPLETKLLARVFVKLNNGAPLMILIKCLMIFFPTLLAEDLFQYLTIREDMKT